MRRVAPCGVISAGGALARAKTVRNRFGPTPFIRGRTGVPRPVPPSREPPSSRQIESGAPPVAPLILLSAVLWRVPRCGQNRLANHWHQAAACAPSDARIGATLTAEVVVPLCAAKCECTSQTLAQRMMLPPATTSRMIPQSHQSFLSPDLLIACITVRRMRGSGPCS
jgi:hypothetical protein